MVMGDQSNGKSILCHYGAQIRKAGRQTLVWSF